MNWHGKIKAEKHKNTLSKNMDENIRRKVEETIKAQGSEDLETHDIKKIFDELWEEIAGDIASSAPIEEEDENIKGIMCS